MILYQWTEAITDCLPMLGIHQTLDLSWTLQMLKDDSRIPLAAKERCTERAGPFSDVSKPHRYPLYQNGDPRALPEGYDVASILPSLRDYNQTQIDKRFQSETFTCKICFEPKLGAQSMRFKGCDHVYCKECLKSYFEIQIREGNVNQLSCPDAKCNSQATPAQVTL